MNCQYQRDHVSCTEIMTLLYDSFPTSVSVSTDWLKNLSCRNHGGRALHDIIINELISSFKMLFLMWCNTLWGSGCSFISAFITKCNIFHYPSILPMGKTPIFISWRSLRKEAPECKRTLGQANHSVVHSETGLTKIHRDWSDRVQWWSLLSCPMHICRPLWSKSEMLACTFVC